MIVVYRHFSAVKAIKFYANQGVTVFPGACNFFIGNINIVGRWEKVRLNSQDDAQIKEADESDEMVKSTFNWALDQLDGSVEVGSYDAAKNPVVISNFVGQIQILIADPQVLKDMFSTKNQLVDKTDENWKAKRKATTHAFYRKRMVNMLEVLKDKIGEACESWNLLIDKNGGESTIDIAHETRKLFARNIIHIAFGEDIEEEKFELYVRGDLQANTFVPAMVSMSDAISETFDQTLITIRNKAIDPLYLPIYYLTEKTAALTSKLR